MVSPGLDCNPFQWDLVTQINRLKIPLRDILPRRSRCCSQSRLRIQFTQSAHLPLCDQNPESDETLDHKEQDHRYDADTDDDTYNQGYTQSRVIEEAIYDGMLVDESDVGHYHVCEENEHQIDGMVPRWMRRARNDNLEKGEHAVQCMLSYICPDVSRCRERLVQDRPKDD